MSRKTSGVNYSRTVNKQSRRKRVLEMLNKQLTLGTKTEKKSSKQILLTDNDITRIKKEINTLKNRL